MKKLGVVLLMVLVTTGAVAQGIDLGLKAGVNFANITDAQQGAADLDLSSRTGLVVGAFVGAKLSDKFGIQADLLYSQQGAEFDAGEFNLDYVNVPIVAKIFLVKGFHVQAGPQFGVVVNDDAQTVIGEVINDIAVNDFEVSGVVGIGYDVPLGLRLEGRYNFGFSDVPEAEGASGKNSVVTLSIGYSFL
ncbi:porin family protein [Marinirhabdus gelatinilytica]|uniref:Outer membrane protein with beta-barrel domain n=1 Tax=Marinirhabdus gelatinilytica TaxID=1703343 RepID=A0A370QAN4_9FLAO|nr:porin family protein [Marinirhabdus gelatinilytica]RDK85349.1 outer membrane protein with beta-barrel domain [Marinirhabdus gelatinilytica]